MAHRLVVFTTLALHVSNASAQDNELRLDRINPAQLEPYVQRFLDSATRSLDRLLAFRGKRTVENTLRPYDDYRLIINRGRVVSLLADVHPDSAVRAAAARAENLITAYNQQRRLDRRIYDMIRAVDTAGVDPEVRLWVRRDLENFQRESIDRPPAVRAQVMALQRELDRLGQEWDENPIRDTITAAFDSTELAGMSAPWLAAHKRTADGKILVVGDEMRGVIAQATLPKTRERALLISLRLRPNHFVLDTMLHKRHALATLLGFRSYADYQLQNTMAGSAKGARTFLDEVRRLTEPAMRRAFEARLARSDSTGAHLVALYDLVSAEGTPGGRFGGVGVAIRPYLPYTRVRDGIFELAREFLDLEFRAAPDISVWHPTVEPYRVYKDGQLIANIYLDLHWRPGRSPIGASASVFRTGVRDRSIVEAALVGGMVRALPGEPALLGPRPMETLFHEFGHLLHTLLSVRPWFATSGLPNDFDFREVPSRLFEEWAKDPDVVARFARHYQTGEAPPRELLERLRVAASPGGGFMAQFTSRMSLELHDRPPGDMHALIRHAFNDVLPPGFPYAVPFPEGDLHPEISLPHLGNGYDAAYYTYLWSAAIAQDLLTRFDKGLLDRDAIQTYRKYILEPGRSRSATELVEGFLGRPFSLEAWSKTLGPP
jgi:Zn-dependent oligopeptidase